MGVAYAEPTYLAAISLSHVLRASICAVESGDERHKSAPLNVTDVNAVDIDLCEFLLGG